MGMPSITFKEFQTLLEDKGFSLREISGTHYIYVNDNNEQVVLPYYKKQVKPIMAKVILNRLKRGGLRQYQATVIARTKG